MYIDCTHTYVAVKSPVIWTNVYLLLAHPQIYKNEFMSFSQSSSKNPMLLF